MHFLSRKADAVVVMRLVYGSVDKLVSLRGICHQMILNILKFLIAIVAPDVN